MQRFILYFVILVVFKVQIGHAQSSLTVTKMKDSVLIKALNNSILIAENREEELSVRVYILDNGSGSAGFESCEVSHNILVAVSEWGENPPQSLFEVGPMYNPKFIKWQSTESSKEFEIEHGVYQERQSISIRVEIDNLETLE